MLALQRARPGALTVPPTAPATKLCALSLHSTQLLFPSRRSSTTRCRAMADSVTQPLPHLARVRGVLFDIDGTLTNSDPLHFQAFQELLVEAGFNNGVPIDDIFYNERISGRHNPEIAADLFPEWPEQERTAFYTAKEERFRKLAGSRLSRTPGLTELLDWLDGRGLPSVAVTNAPAANTELMLGALSLSDYFKAVVLGEQCERAKPHPDPYLQGLAVLGIAANEAFAVEDSPSGVRAAVAAGLAVVGIASGHSPETLRAAGCCLVLPDFHGLVSLALEQSEESPAAVISVCGKAFGGSGTPVVLAADARSK